MIRFECSHCGKSYVFSDRFTGREMICTGCKTFLIVPEPNGPEDELDIPLPPPVPISVAEPVAEPMPEPAAEVPLVLPIDSGLTFPELVPHDPALPPPPSAIIPPPPPVPAPPPPPEVPAPPAPPVPTAEQVVEPVSQPQESNSSEPELDFVIPNEKSNRWKRRILQAGIALLIPVILGLAFYFVQQGDKEPDPRPELLQQLEQQASAAQNRSNDLEHNLREETERIQDQWRQVGALCDLIMETASEQLENKLTQTALTQTLTEPGLQEERITELKQTRQELQRSARSIEERLVKLYQNYRDALTLVSESERKAKQFQEDASIASQESNFYQEQAEQLRLRMDQEPDQWEETAWPEFDRRSIQNVQNSPRFEQDWTEQDYSFFSFPDAQPNAFAFSFDDRQQLFGRRSLRLASLTRSPVTLLFPESRQADASCPDARYVVFSLAFPEQGSRTAPRCEEQSCKIGEMRVRLGGSWGYVEYRTQSKEYCEAVYYDGLGQFTKVEFPIEGDLYWVRSDHLLESGARTGDDEIDSLFEQDSQPAAQWVPTEGGDEFLSHLDWAELRFTPLSTLTAFQLDGIALLEQRESEPYDLQAAQSRHRRLREAESTEYNRRVKKRTELLPSADWVEISPSNAVSDAVVVDENNLEFEGSQGERTKRLFQWVLESAKGRIRATVDGKAQSFGAKSRMPDEWDQVVVLELELAGYQALGEPQLAQIASLDGLKMLDLSRTGLRDRHVSQLSTLVSLESLNLSGNELTYDALPALRTLKNLKVLKLDGIQASAEGLDALGALTGLKTLSMARSALDGADLNYLLPLDDLEYLDLSGTRLGDRGLKTLRVFTSLKHLNLSRTRITNKGIAALSGLIDLETLQLDHTSLTNESLGSFKRLSSSLETISAMQTGITPEGVRNTLGPTWQGRFKLSSQR